MTLVEHLAELRRRIIISVLALALGVVVGFYYSSPMVQFLLRLPGSWSTSIPVKPFCAPGSGFGGGDRPQFTGCPLPGGPLYRTRAFGPREAHPPGGPARGFADVCRGTVFAYQVILPLAYRFFLGFGTESLTPMISIGNYVSFVIRLVLPLDWCFSCP